jgi:cytochrome P450
MRSLIQVGPPDHTRPRRLVSTAFTPRRVAALRPRVQQITDGLLDAVVPDGRADLVADVALPLPVTVICEILGVPLEDREDFQKWTDLMLGQHPGRPAEKEAVEDAWRRMWAYLQDLLGAKRERPGDDMLSALIAARDEGGSLDEDELISMSFLLLSAGYMTTANLIGGGMAALFADPAQLALLREDPDLLPGAIEEFLRYDGPLNPGLVRFPTEDVRIGGVTIPRGATVLIATAVADRDEAVFPDPDRLDVTRRENPIWRSGTAFTTAWARRWPGWRARSRSARSCGGCRTWRSRCRTARCRGRSGSFAAPRRCRSPSRRREHAARRRENPRR